MVRPKEFDRDNALDEAMRVFWTYGFEATTMSDLQRALGIGRQSLYNTFGDKQAVFAEALQRYIGISKVQSNSLLGGPNGLDAINSFFDGCIGSFVSSNPRRACLIFNTGAELCSHDENIKSLVNTGLKNLQTAFGGALERAKAQGELHEDADIRTLAMYLTSQVGGLAIMSKAGASRKQLQAVADTSLSILR